MNSSFESKVYKALGASGISVHDICEDNPLGVAVSGGADSVSLLVALNALFGSGGVRVITVNHGIRKKEETDGDEFFVRNLCAEYKIDCTAVRIPDGDIFALAELRKKGVEEAARFVRYECFRSFYREKKIAALCLAHNQNDQLETLLMRFLNGSGSESAGGIPAARDFYVRPLLGIARDEIENYLNEKNIEWRTDSTNRDTDYLRNRIRNVLVPCLDRHFDGWRAAVLAGRKKALDDAGALKEAAEKVEVYSDDSGSVFMERKRFFGQPNAVRRRCVYMCLNKIGYGERFPYRIIEELFSWENEPFRTVAFGGITISADAERISFRRTDCRKIGAKNHSGAAGGFSFLLKHPGDEISGNTFRAVVSGDCASSVLAVSCAPGNGSMTGKTVVLNVSLPVLVRSVEAGDKIRTAEQGFKSVADILDNWKIHGAERQNVLVIEEIGVRPEIKALVGSHIGAADWIVRD